MRQDFKTNMVRLRGWGKRSERLVGHAPFGHWKSTTLVAALGCEGICGSLLLDGPMNRKGFEAFLEESLIPVLKPGDTVIMDNLPAHKGGQIDALFQAAGVVFRYLPPYSPDLNPIEMAFSKIKQTLRGLAYRTVDELWDGMQSVLDQVLPEQALAFFRHAGYTL